MYNGNPVYNMGMRKEGNAGSINNKEYRQDNLQCFFHFFMLHTPGLV